MDESETILLRSGGLCGCLKSKRQPRRSSDWFDQTIEIFGEPNTKPVAQFSVDRNRVYVDEPIIYTDESFDPDGDEIVEWNWQNKKRDIFHPGHLLC